MSFMYWENHVFVSSSPAMMMLCNNVTTPVPGGVNTCPDSRSDTPTSDPGLKLVPESKPDDIRSSSAARAMDSASVGCLWWRRESDCACGEEGGWRWRREERVAVRHRPARDTSSWLSPFTRRDVRTIESEREREKQRKRGRGRGEKETSFEHSCSLVSHLSQAGQAC